jgi:hypothetical protein
MVIFHSYVKLPEGNSQVKEAMVCIQLFFDPLQDRLHESTEVAATQTF